MRKNFRLPGKNLGLQAFLGAACLQLQGQRLTRIRRSVGSVLLIDLGKLQKVRYRNRVHQNGEWCFLVDGAWKIVKNKKTLLEWRHVSDEIDERAPLLLEGKKIKQVLIRRSGAMQIDFTDDTQVAIKKFTYGKGYVGGWCLFCRNLWAISNTDKNDFYKIEF